MLVPIILSVAVFVSSVTAVCQDKNKESCAEKAAKGACYLSDSWEAIFEECPESCNQVDIPSNLIVISNNNMGCSCCMFGSHPVHSALLDPPVSETKVYFIVILILLFTNQ